MMKKYLIRLSVLTVAASMLVACNQQPEEKAKVEEKKISTAIHYPADSMFYASADNAAQLLQDPRYAQFLNELYKMAELTPEQITEATAFLSSVKSISVGAGEISYKPLKIEAGSLMHASFTPEQIEELKELYTESFSLTETDPIGDFKVYTRVLTQPATAKTAEMSGAIFMTLPANDLIAVAGDRAYLEFMLSNPAESTNSLAQDPDFKSMRAKLDTSSQDTLGFMRTQAYFDTIFNAVSQIGQEATKEMRIPFSIDMILNALKTNMGLQDWGNAISSWDMEQKTGLSKMEFNPESPSYKQFTYTKPLAFPHVPADATQVMLINMNDPQQGFIDFVGMLNATAKVFIPPAMGEPSALAENAVGFKFADLAAHFSGPLAFWQTADMDNPKNQHMCIRLGVKDAEAFKNFLFSIPALAQINPVESDGIFSIAGQASWAFQDGAFYFGSSPAYLKQSLATDSPDLFASAEFKELFKRVDPSCTMLQYANYSSIVNGSMNQIKSTPETAALLDAYFKIFSGMSMLETSVAKDGMFISKTVITD